MRPKAARNAAELCRGPSAYSLIRIRVPMCGSTASYSRRSAARAQPGQASHATAPRLMPLPIVFHTAIPVPVHLIRPGHFLRAHEAETEPLGIRLIPDTLGQLRILLLPGGVGRHARGTAQHIRLVVPGTA